MSIPVLQSDNSTCWLLGAGWSKGDQFARFIEEGIWQNGYDDKYFDLVKSIKVNDRVAIKSSYTKKNGLPFETNGNTVSVNAIKAIGLVTENLMDGKTIRVNWIPLETPREWYFFTNRTTIWRLVPDDAMRENLIDFAFNAKEQNYPLYINHPYWKDRFGLVDDKDRQYKWTGFYSELANKLISYRNNRPALLAKAYDIFKNIMSDDGPKDQYSDGTSGPWRDIDPFTMIGIFNRGIRDEKRRAIAAELAHFLSIESPVPTTFEAIPILNNLKAWYFRYEKDRDSGDIDLLWDLFEAAIRYADQENEQENLKNLELFSELFDKAMNLGGVGWNLTSAIYWIRPWTFLTLDSNSRAYIKKKLNLTIDKTGSKDRISAAGYMSIIDDLQSLFKDDNYPVHSFPDLSNAAWVYTRKIGVVGDEPEDVVESPPEIPGKVTEDPEKTVTLPSYALTDIVKDGCFYSIEELDNMISRLRYKKNMILQGPPGTGKTWLAKRLAWAFIGLKDEQKIRSMQFHPNLSYEDFVRGWRPSGDGKLSLSDGPFLEVVNNALKDPQSKFVIVIEEINRGNPAQIFGEMLTLMEADKRTPSEAMELSYRRSEDETVFIPPNVYIIGTMNIADRSLALVDYALRRRFAFIDLEPRIGQVWKNWLNTHFNLEITDLELIQLRMNKLNNEIETDSQLGPQFRVGHSYVTPIEGQAIRDARTWFKQVVMTEIVPLLKEYWYEGQSSRISSIQDMLTEGL